MEDQEGSVCNHGNNGNLAPSSSCRLCLRFMCFVAVGLVMFGALLSCLFRCCVHGGGDSLVHRHQHSSQQPTFSTTDAATLPKWHTFVASCASRSGGFALAFAEKAPPLSASYASRGGGFAPVLTAAFERSKRQPDNLTCGGGIAPSTMPTAPTASTAEWGTVLESHAREANFVRRIDPGLTLEERAAVEQMSDEMMADRLMRAREARAENLPFGFIGIQNLAARQHDRVIADVAARGASMAYPPRDRERDREVPQRPNSHQPGGRDPRHGRGVRRPRSRSSSLPRWDDNVYEETAARRVGRNRLDGFLAPLVDTLCHAGIEDAFLEHGAGMVQLEGTIRRCVQQHQHLGGCGIIHVNTICELAQARAIVGVNVTAGSLPPWPTPKPYGSPSTG